MACLYRSVVGVGVVDKRVPASQAACRYSNFDIMVAWLCITSPTCAQLSGPTMSDNVRDIRRGWHHLKLSTSQRRTRESVAAVSQWRPSGVACTAVRYPSCATAALLPGCDTSGPSSSVLLRFLIQQSVSHMADSRNDIQRIGGRIYKLSSNGMSSVGLIL